MSGFLRVLRLFLLIMLNLFITICGTIIKFLPLTQYRKLRLQTRGMQWWAQAGCRILGIHIVPSGSYRRDDVFFVVSNHCSYIDILVIGSMVQSVFVSKSDVASWLFLGRMVRLAGTIFVDRESKIASVKVLETINERLRNGVSVVVFPEGTTNNGLAMRDFKSTFFKAPIDSGVPILPVSIIYSHIEGMPVTPGTIDTVAWHSDMEFLSHFWNLLSIRRIDAHVHFSQSVSNFTKDRKVLASIVFEKVRDGYNRNFCEEYTLDNVP